MEEQLAVPADPLFACSLCRSLLEDAVQLACLHNCCRRCFSRTVSQSRSRDISCTVCGTTTREGTEQTNSFIEKEVQRYVASIEPRSCDICKGNGEVDKPALVWCPTCRHFLCGDCIAPHRHYYRQHRTQSLEELKSLEEMCPKPLASTCPTHMKPLEIACLNCEQPKCISCWRDCKKSNHEFHIVGDEAFDHYVCEIISCISFMESKILQKSAVLEKAKNIVSDTKVARALHLEQINERKRRIIDSVEMAYHQIESSTKNTYDDLEKDATLVSDTADCIASSLSNARSYIGRLIDSNDKCEILHQRKTVLERLRVLSSDVDSLKEKLGKAVTAVKFDPLIPGDLDNVIKSWIGMPLLNSALSFAAAYPQQQQPVSFRSASASVEVPFNGYDVALMKGGSLLLAARDDGVIEFCWKTGRELSRWPPFHNWDDGVRGVAAVNDGRVAVSLRNKHRVMLLRRSAQGDNNGTNAAGASVWSVDRQYDLPWQPWRLSVYGDMMAVSEERLSRGRLQILSVSSGQQLSVELQREYDIYSVAVTDRLVVTGSYCCHVQLSSGRPGDVIDAHSLADGDERLWRHELSSGDHLKGFTVDPGGGCLYAAVQSTVDRVSALSLTDGSELQCIALSFDSEAPKSPTLRPLRLSLIDDDGRVAKQQPQSSMTSSSSRILLMAVMCYNLTTKRDSTVTMHLSKCDK